MTRETYLGHRELRTAGIGAADFCADRARRSDVAAIGRTLVVVNLYRVPRLLDGEAGDIARRSVLHQASPIGRVVVTGEIDADPRAFRSVETRIIC